MRHDFTKGTDLNEDELTRLHALLERQRVRSDQLVEELREKRERQFDFIADTRTLEMAAVPEDAAETLPACEEVERLEGRKPKVAIIPSEQTEAWFKSFGPVAANAHAHQQICNRTPIGIKYYKHMLAQDPTLLAANVNRWWHRTPSRRMVRCEIAKENGQRPMGFARAFLSDKYRRLDNLEVCETILPVLTDEASPWDVTQCGVTDLAVHIEVKAPNLTADVKVGDPVMLAVKIQTGEVGNRALTVQLGCYRIKCSNLLMVPEWSQRQVHVGRSAEEFVELLSEATIKAEDKLVLDKMRDVVRAMYDRERFAELVALAGRSADEDVAGLQSPIHATQLLAEEAGLSHAEGVLCWNEMMRGGEPTVWGLANALTATARDVEFEHKARLEAFAGRLISDEGGWNKYIKAA